MLHVELDNILTHDELASKAEEVLRKADDENKIVVITRNGRPAVAVLKLEQLEELSGRSVSTHTPPVELPHVAPAPAMSAPTPMPITADAPVATITPPHDLPPTAEMPVSPSPMPDSHDEHSDNSGLPDMPSM